MSQLIATTQVGEVMTKEVITANENDTLNRLVHLFKKHHIRHIPIVNEDEVVGIVSRTDINRLTFGALFNEESTDDAILKMLTIPQVMSARPKTVSTKESIFDVADIFTENDFHAIPVVEDQKIVGIVTTTDVIKYFRSRVE